ncbi:ribulose-phosphate 3-epimerase [Desulfatirhabdium butyrativorans]|uniref:ribulose-phosphate 3-epimerase n=1 Tax=Desulfatirhabdium butyrativorans TaxID=340467 RepID=UPI00048657C4|nr:ribulose-phosphate 3-epimerase [Desulfatirhabdium butyrativorans]
MNPHPDPKPHLIAPSILSADFSRLGAEIQEVIRAGADWIHVDVMDGHFVPNITMGPLVVEAVRKVAPDIVIDVHLMIENPERYIEDFAKAGATCISVQLEACTHLHRCLQQIHHVRCQAGVALNPATPPEGLSYVLNELDFVLVMSVNPGFGGQAFIPSSLEKIRVVRKMLTARGLDRRIQVDGGVNETTIAEVARAGCDVFVAGSAIFGRPPYQETIARLRRKIEEALL